MKPLLPILTSLLLAFCVGAAALFAYATIWGVCYRIPRTASVIVDERAAGSQSHYWISFRASLATNAHGFPGHAYIVWSDGESMGFVPKYSADQIPSLYRTVPGAMQLEGPRLNTRNIGAVDVLVDEAEWHRSKAVAQNFDCNSFRVGSRDCVAFCNEVARSIDLPSPRIAYRFPQDYLSDLQKLCLQQNAEKRTAISTAKARRANTELCIKPSSGQPWMQVSHK